MKPDADEKYRGPHRPMRSSCPDIEVNDRLPRTAAVMDKVTLIKSVHHKMTNHNSAGYYALTGKAPPSDDQRLRESIDQQARLMDFSAEAKGLDEYYAKALGMLNSTRIREAFNLAAESNNMREAYGRTTYGQGCLLARRLAESGVRFTTCYFSDRTSQPRFII